MLNRPCHVFSWSEAHQVSYQGISLMFSSQRELGLMRTEVEVCLCKFDACSNAQVLCLLWLLKTHGHTGDQAKTHARAALARLPTSTTQGVSWALRVISMQVLTNIRGPCAQSCSKLVIPLFLYYVMCSNKGLCHEEGLFTPLTVPCTLKRSSQGF